MKVVLWVYYFLELIQNSKKAQVYLETQTIATTVPFQLRHLLPSQLINQLPSRNQRYVLEN